jgi:cobalt-zinc-cadmium efflux system outer membrane protein
MGFTLDRGSDMKIKTLLRGAMLALIMTAQPAAASTEAEAYGLAQLIAEALAQNPSVDAMRHRTRQLGAMAEVSSTWADPVVGVSYVNAPVDSFSIKDHPMSGVEFKLEQRLPEFGWTRTAQQVADLGVSRSRHAQAEAEVQLGRSIETLYWKLALSRQLEGVTQKHLDRTLELIRAVRARYEVGKAGQNTLLRLDVLRDRLRDDLGDFETAERKLSAGLARAVAREARAKFATPSDIDAVAPGSDLTTWIEQAQLHRPELAAIREDVKRQEKSATLARISNRPEVGVWVKYRLRVAETAIDDGTDFFSAGVSVPIPWGSRKRSLGGQAAGFAARDRARAQLAASLDTIEAELIGIDADWRRATAKAATYKNTLIPAASIALETTLSDFSVGKAEFSTLYEAEVELLMLERSYLTATIETYLQRAAARAATGRRDLGDPS